MNEEKSAFCACHLKKKKLFCPFCSCEQNGNFLNGAAGQIKLQWCQICDKEFRYIAYMEGRKIRFSSFRRYDFSARGDACR